MINYFIGLSILIGLVTTISCTPPKSLSSTIQPVSRTIIIDGDTISEKSIGGITSWQCKDYIDGGRTLVEVGFFDDPSLNGIGFILYDGGNSGVSADCYRAGLDHRWDWESNNSNYSFVVKTDGTGLYYDFSTVPKGETTKAREVYKCYQK